MKILRVLLVAVVASVCCMFIRAGVRRFLPSVYSSVWGVPPRGEIVVPKVVQAVAAPVVAALVPVAPSAPSPVEKKEAEIYATGRVWRGREFLVVMSDGTVRSPRDNTDEKKPRVTNIDKHFMDYDGKRYWYKPHVEVASKIVPVAVSLPVEVEKVEDPVASPAIREDQSTAVIKSPDGGKFVPIPHTPRKRVDRKA